MLPVAVDAMGGDHAPDVIVAGARRAVAELGVPVVAKETGNGISPRERGELPDQRLNVLGAPFDEPLSFQERWGQNRIR